MPARRIVLFAKPPVPGRVKTRLAPLLGPEDAARLYAAMLADVVALGRADDLEKVLYVEPPVPSGAPLPPTEGWRVEFQRGSSLADRLEDAFAREAADGARVVVRGTDCVLVGAEREEEAFSALAAADVVFGPDGGGGYYLVGLARPAPGLFAGVATSVEDNYARTLGRARELGLKAAQLPVALDVDRPPDVVRLAELFGADPGAKRLAPRTCRLLLRWKRRLSGWNDAG